MGYVGKFDMVTLNGTAKSIFNNREFLRNDICQLNENKEGRQKRQKYSDSTSRDNACLAYVCAFCLCYIYVLKVHCVVGYLQETCCSAM